MESQLAFLDCAAWLDGEGLARCGLPAEVLHRFIMEPTSGPLESVIIINARLATPSSRPSNSSAWKGDTVTGPPRRVA